MCALATPLYGLTFGLSILAIGIGAVLYQKKFIPEEISVQDRHDGPSSELDRLITAAPGAMRLAHRERFEKAKTQRELAEERFRPGGHPTPMPNPGVFARHNAVDLEARLPDGSGSDLSVAAILQRRRGAELRRDVVCRRRRGRISRREESG